MAVLFAPLFQLDLLLLKWLLNAPATLTAAKPYSGTAFLDDDDDALYVQPAMFAAVIIFINGIDVWLLCLANRYSSVY